MPNIPKEKNPAAVALGRLGGAKGGKAKFANMTPNEKAAFQSSGARARWDKMTPEERVAAMTQIRAARWSHLTPEERREQMQGNVDAMREAKRKKSEGG